MSLGKEKLEEFRILLTSRREALRVDLGASTRQMLDTEESYSDSVDQASADSDRALMMQMKNRETEILLQLNEALRRLDRGAYGDCERCDDAISEGRMRAFPLSTLCIDCKSELESQGINEIRYSGRA